MLDDSDMFESGACFDPNSHQQLLIDDHDLSNFHQIPNFSPADHFHHQQINWNHNLHHPILSENNDINFSPTQTPSDILNLFQSPICSSSIPVSNPAQINQTSGQIIYDPLLPFNISPTGFNLAGWGSVFGEMDMERGEPSQLYHEEHAAFEFNAGIINNNTKHFASEKHRRQQLNVKFEALRSLIPNPTKVDRASIVGDAIEYINKLKRDLEELKISVDMKRCSNRSRMKRNKTEDDSNLTSTMKSLWVQRKSKNIEIDVRIIDDEVTIKLVQQKRNNCLLVVSKVLDELKLDVHHVAGGLIGDFYSYLFNNKICEGSTVYASAIANKLIEVVDKQYATDPVTSS